MVDVTDILGVSKGDGDNDDISRLTVELGKSKVTSILTPGRKRKKKRVPRELASLKNSFEDHPCNETDQSVFDVGEGGSKFQSRIKIGKPTSITRWRWYPIHHGGRRRLSLLPPSTERALNHTVGFGTIHEVGNGDPAIRDQFSDNTNPHEKMGPVLLSGVNVADLYGYSSLNNTALSHTTHFINDQDSLVPNVVAQHMESTAAMLSTVVATKTAEELEGIASIATDRTLTPPATDAMSDTTLTNLDEDTLRDVYVTLDSCLKHWSQHEVEIDYKFSKMDRVLKMIRYSDEEYALFGAHSRWTRAQTDLLFDLCMSYDLRFLVVHDRIATGRSLLYNHQYSHLALQKVYQGESAQLVVHNNEDEVLHNIYLSDPVASHYSVRVSGSVSGDLVGHVQKRRRIVGSRVVEVLEVDPSDAQYSLPSDPHTHTLTLTRLPRDVSESVGLSARRRSRAPLNCDYMSDEDEDEEMKDEETSTTTSTTTESKSKNKNTHVRLDYDDASAGRIEKKLGEKIKDDKKSRVYSYSPSEGPAVAVLPQSPEQTVVAGHSDPPQLLLTPAGHIVADPDDVFLSVSLPPTRSLRSQLPHLVDEADVAVSNVDARRLPLLPSFVPHSITDSLSLSAPVPPVPASLINDPVAPVDHPSTLRLLWLPQKDDTSSQPSRSTAPTAHMECKSEGGLKPLKQLEPASQPLSQPSHNTVANSLTILNGSRVKPEDAPRNPVEDECSVWRGNWFPSVEEVKHRFFSMQYMTVRHRLQTNGVLEGGDGDGEEMMGSRQLMEGEEEDEEASDVEEEEKTDQEKTDSESDTDSDSDEDLKKKKTSKAKPKTPAKGRKGKAAQAASQTPRRRGPRFVEADETETGDGGEDEGKEDQLKEEECDSKLKEEDGSAEARDDDGKTKDEEAGEGVAEGTEGTGASSAPSTTAVSTASNAVLSFVYEPHIEFVRKRVDHTNTASIFSPTPPPLHHLFDISSAADPSVAYPTLHNPYQVVEMRRITRLLTRGLQPHLKPKYNPNYVAAVATPGAAVVPNFIRGRGRGRGTRGGVPRGGSICRYFLAPANPHSYPYRYTSTLHGNEFDDEVVNRLCDTALMTDVDTTKRIECVLFELESMFRNCDMYVRTLNKGSIKAQKDRKRMEKRHKRQVRNQRKSETRRGRGRGRGAGRVNYDDDDTLYTTISDYKHDRNEFVVYFYNSMTTKSPHKPPVYVALLAIEGLEEEAASVAAKNVWSHEKYLAVQRDMITYGTRQPILIDMKQVFYTAIAANYQLPMDALQVTATLPFVAHPRLGIKMIADPQYISQTFAPQHYVQHTNAVTRQTRSYAYWPSPLMNVASPSCRSQYDPVSHSLPDTPPHHRVSLPITWMKPLIPNTFVFYSPECGVHMLSTMNAVHNYSLIQQGLGVPKKLVELLFSFSGVHCLLPLSITTHNTYYLFQCIRTQLVKLIALQNHYFLRMQYLENLKSALLQNNNSHTNNNPNNYLLHYPPRTPISLTPVTYSSPSPQYTYPHTITEFSRETAVDVGEAVLASCYYNPDAS